MFILMYNYVIYFLGKAKEGKISGGGREAGNWYCSTCTFCHDQLEQQQFMSCDMCGSERGMVR